MQIESDRQVIRFPHKAAPRREPRGWDAPGHALPGDIEKRPYIPESVAEHRHRMWVNFLSAVVIFTLMITGGWVVNGLVKTTRASQDCYRPGASDCGAIYIPLPPRSLAPWSQDGLRS
jgi:hypothetical protein